jgi:hypothetical protein
MPHYEPHDASLVMLKSKIDKPYEKHNCARGCQGDILRDVKIRRVIDEDKVEDIELPYVVLLSQDCDIEQSLKNAIPDDIDPAKNNQYLPNALIIPAFTADSVRAGNHLSELFGINQDRISSGQFKIIKQNNNDRYHFLNAYPSLQIPDLLIDFKIYFSIEYNIFFKFYADGGYLGTINELFRERLSQRFTNYLGRIGLPENAENCFNA